MSPARLRAVCRSDERSAPKENVGRGELRPGWGLVGDSHAGPPHPGRWQVSLLAWEEVERANGEFGIGAVPGSFAENLTTEGLDLSILCVGDRLQIGDASAACPRQGGDPGAGEVVLEVEQLGKPPQIAHTYRFQGHSLLPTRGVFCRVVAGGTVAVGDEVCLIPRGEPTLPLGSSPRGDAG